MFVTPAGEIKHVACLTLVAYPEPCIKDGRVAATSPSRDCEGPVTFDANTKPTQDGRTKVLDFQNRTIDIRMHTHQAAQQDTAQSSTARCSKAQRSTVQHITARRDISHLTGFQTWSISITCNRQKAQHSTAQSSTLRYTTRLIHHVGFHDVHQGAHSLLHSFQQVSARIQARALPDHRKSIVVRGRPGVLTIRL